MSRKMKALVTGGTGFVGGNVVRELTLRGHKAVCLVRPGAKGEERVRELGAEVVHGDVTDPESFEWVPQVDAVVNCVGIIREKNGGTFEAIHVRAPRYLVDLANRCDAKKFVHVSAMGTRPGAASEYHRTKWEGEVAVRMGKIPWTIFRPSVIFGNEAWGRPGEFVRVMLGLHGKVAGLMTPVAGSGKTKVQPVSVSDVARCVVDALENPKTDNRIYDLGGPKVHTFKEVQKIICRGYYGKTKLHLHVPVGLMKAAALVVEPLLPFTREQLKLLEEDGVCSMEPTREAFRGAFTDFEEWCNHYLGPQSPASVRQFEEAEFG